MVSVVLDQPSAGGGPGGGGSLPWPGGCGGGVFGGFPFRLGPWRGGRCSPRRGGPPLGPPSLRGDSSPCSSSQARRASRSCGLSRPSSSPSNCSRISARLRWFRSRRRSIAWWASMRSSSLSLPSPSASNWATTCGGSAGRSLGPCFGCMRCPRSCRWDGVRMSTK